MNRSGWTVLLALLLVSGLVQGQELKIATLAPDGSAWMNEFRQAAERIEADTEQRVRIRYYPGGVMGDAGAVLRRMRLGQLQGGAFTLGDLAPVSNAVNLYSLPFFFRDESELLELREEFDPLILAALAEGGIVAPAVSLGGFAYFFSREAFPDSDRLSSSWRVWVPSGDTLSRHALERAGASPVPLALAEVYTALQTGTINTFASTPSAAIILQWHSRARHMLDLPVLMTAGTVGLDQRSWQRLSAADRETLSRHFSTALARLEATGRDDNQAAREALDQQGIRIAEPTPAQVAAWQELARESRRQLHARGQIEIPHLAELEARLEQLRESAAD
jgi:TRAP-type transport system periplasmic protein